MAIFKNFRTPKIFYKLQDCQIYLIWIAFHSQLGVSWIKRSTARFSKRGSKINVDQVWIKKRGSSVDHAWIKTSKAWITKKRGSSVDQIFLVQNQRENFPLKRFSPSILKRGSRVDQKFVSWISVDQIKTWISVDQKKRGSSVDHKKRGSKN